MARKVLVIGGTRYFGKRLVSLLLQNGDQVTLANRGHTPFQFEKPVRHIKVDRTHDQEFKKAFASESFDLVFDQFCYSPNEARSACETFNGRIARYIYTSTLSIYPSVGEFHETDVDPLRCEFSYGSKNDFSYSDAKRFAEAAFFKNATFPVAAARIPLVFGEDDYTGRLDFHIERILKGRPIVIPSLNTRISLIHAQDAANFLFWLGSSFFTGALNGAAPTPISMGELIALISKLAGKTPIIQTKGLEEDETPIADFDSRYLNVERALALGCPLRDLNEWLEPLVRQRVHALQR